MLRTIAAVGMLMMTGAPLSAQSPRIAIAPYAGVYLPVADVLEAITLGGRAVASLGHSPAPVLGGRIAVRFARVGVEADVGYTPSNVDLPDIVRDSGVTDDANVLMGTLNFTYAAFEAPFTPVSFHISGGAGFVHRGGDFFENFENLTSFAGAAGVTLRVGLGPLAHLRADLRDYVYSFKPRLGSRDFEGKLQNDLVASVGVEFVFRPTP